MHHLNTPVLFADRSSAQLRARGGLDGRQGSVTDAQTTPRAGMEALLAASLHLSAVSPARLSLLLEDPGILMRGNVV